MLFFFFCNSSSFSLILPFHFHFSYFLKFLPVSISPLPSLIPHLLYLSSSPLIPLFLLFLLFFNLSFCSLISSPLQELFLLSFNSPSPPLFPSHLLLSFLPFSDSYSHFSSTFFVFIILFFFFFSLSIVDILSCPWSCYRV